MRYSRIVCALMVLVFAVLITGCKESGQTTTQTGMRITDMTGRSVHLSGPVERIVSISAADCEILYALEAGDLLVGRSTYCDYPEQILEVPVVQSGEDTNAEQIIALNPQLVLMSAMAQSEDQIQLLEAAGIPVIISNVQDIDGLYTAIQLVGQVSGKEAGATALVRDLQERFALMKDRAAAAADGESPTIYFEVSPLEWGLWTAGRNTFMDEIAGMLGLINAFDDVNGWGEISQEQVIERSPDYIVTVTMYDETDTPPSLEILSRKGWESVKAVKNGTVFELDNDAFTRPGPRLADAAEALCDLIYG